MRHVFSPETGSGTGSAAAMDSSGDRKQQGPAEGGGPGMPAKDYVEHLKKINDVFYDQIKIADQKAAYIFTFMLAFLITSADGRAAFRLDGYGGSNLLFSAVSIVLALAASVSILAAIIVVLPRRRTSMTTLFWGGWDRCRADFMAASSRADPAYVYGEYLSNIDNLSLIAKAKYRCVSIAFHALMVMVVAYLLRLALAA